MKFKLIQAFMAIIVTCKNEEDSSKNEGVRVVKTNLPYESMGIFPDDQLHSGLILPNFNLILAFMAALVKN